MKEKLEELRKQKNRLSDEYGKERHHPIHHHPAERHTEMSVRFDRCPTTPGPHTRGRGFIQDGITDGISRAATQLLY